MMHGAREARYTLFDRLLDRELADRLGQPGSALYTADRFGLIASADFYATMRSIFKLSPWLFDELERFENEALVAVLNPRDGDGDILFQELALRSVELLRFAARDEFRRMVGSG